MTFSLIYSQMDNKLFSGKLRERPLSFLMFEFWRSRKNGKLSLKQGKHEKILFFDDGQIAITLNSFNEKKFFSDLIQKNIIEAESLEKILLSAKQDNKSLIKVCIENHLISVPALWAWIKNYSMLNILPFFDKEDVDFLFSPESKPDKRLVLCRIKTLDLLLQGLRQMTNLNFMTAHLPEEDRDVQMLPPKHQSEIPLLPHEEYLQHLLSHLHNLKTVYKHSLLSREETQKVIFTFLSLGLCTFTSIKKTKTPLFDFSQAELDSILNSFNRKWHFIFKYMSKELGPVALNILEKSLTETKSRLSPLFQSVKLHPDGQIDTNAVLKEKFNFSSQGTKKTLLVGLNEIIVSEVLAVKKTLGDEHEAILVQHLKKIEK